MNYKYFEISDIHEFLKFIDKLKDNVKIISR